MKLLEITLFVRTRIKALSRCFKRIFLNNSKFYPIDRIFKSLFNHYFSELDFFPILSKSLITHYALQTIDVLEAHLN